MTQEYESAEAKAKRQSLFGRFFSRLRFPYLFVLSAILFGVDMVVPDVIPFIDEVILAVNTAVLASWKRSKETKDDGIVDTDLVSHSPPKLEDTSGK